MLKHQRVRSPEGPACRLEIPKVGVGVLEDREQYRQVELHRIMPAVSQPDHHRRVVFDCNECVADGDQKKRLKPGRGYPSGTDGEVPEILILADEEGAFFGGQVDRDDRIGPELLHDRCEYGIDVVRHGRGDDFAVRTQKLQNAVNVRRMRLAKGVVFDDPHGRSVAPRQRERRFGALFRASLQPFDLVDRARAD